MTDLICPFSATLAREDFACPRAGQIIRRGGAEFACDSETSHARCMQVFEHCKQAALPAFAVEDDLTQMPQSVLVKIQFGGLLGLRRFITGQAPDENRIDDIDALLDAASAQFPDPDSFPYAQLVDDITGWKLPRRRRR